MEQSSRDRKQQQKTEDAFKIVGGLLGVINVVCLILCLIAALYLFI